MVKKDPSKFNRNYFIFTDVLGGTAASVLAGQNGLTAGRIHQIFWDFARRLRYVLKKNNDPRLEAIFPKEKYPQAWEDNGYGVQVFQYRSLKLEGWRSEKEAVINLVNALLAEP